MSLYEILKPVIFKLDPEFTHDVALLALRLNCINAKPFQEMPALKTRVFGLNFRSPVGLAAGLDKNACAIKSLAALGFGFVEVGTATNLPQTGNAKPRLFRLAQDQAIINRFGFNNKGANIFVQNLRAYMENGGGNVVIGANIGKNKDCDDAVADYLLMLGKTYGNSDYITINISSPNTPGLRDLQGKTALTELIVAIMARRRQLIAATGKNIPILLKIAPDISEYQTQDIVDVALAQKIDGLIVSNTTVGMRADLQSKHKDEVGGLSGKPLFGLATKVLQDIYGLTKGKIQLVGVGGIFSAEDAYLKIKSGASLVQIYSGLIYKGPGLIDEINQGLVKLLKQDGFSNITEAVGKL